MGADPSRNKYYTRRRRGSRQRDRPMIEIQEEGRRASLGEILWASSAVVILAGFLAWHFFSSH